MPEKSHTLDLRVFVIDYNRTNEFCDIGKSTFVPNFYHYMGVYVLKDVAQELPPILQELDNLQKKYKESELVIRLSVNGHGTETSMGTPRLYDEILTLSKREPNKGMALPKRATPVTLPDGTKTCGVEDVRGVM